MRRENRTEFIIKVFYVIIASVSLFKFRTASIESGLDVSWVYAINKLFHEGVLWGHDVMFTYGPLGFIILPMNFGSNVFISLVYWVFIALSAGLLLSYALFSKRFSLNDNNILLSLFLFYLGNCVIGRISCESVSSFVILCLLSLCVRSGELKFFIMASLLSMLSMFMKFNAGAVDFMILVMFALLFNPAKYIPALFITPALFFICFMAYNPSLSELVYYIRGAYEVSSGYISAMSTSFFTVKSFAVMMTVMLIVYAVILFAILWNSEFFRIKHSLRYAMIFAVPLFGLFRHAFTRSGEGHNFEFMPVLYIWLSVYILFMESRINIRQKFSKFLKYSLCLIFCASFMLSSLGINKLGIWPKMAVYNASTNPFFEFYDRIRSFRSSHEDKRTIRLPHEFVKTVSQDTAAIYPIELSYAQDIPNYKSMPVIQGYNAYTSWLDEQNAEFYSADDAPKFIVFSLEAIDERFPLIECPQTWLEIFRHYEIKLYDPDAKLFLLERSSERKIKAAGRITKTYPRDEKIIIPETNNICIMNINMNLNFTGKLMKTFYKIPAVLMTAEFEDDGRIITKRVLPDTLKNDTIISSLILDDNDFTRFMNGGMNAGKVKSLQFTGDGIKYYSDEMTIAFTELSE